MTREEPTVVEREPLRFRLIHVFYAMAVLGASLATFGVGGVFVAAAVLAMWFMVFWDKPPFLVKDASKPATRSFTLPELLVVIAIIAVLAAILLPAVRSARGAAMRSTCRNNLKQIALALHNYHDTFGSFPPAYIADENGKPMHSWRVLITPFLGSNAVYDLYRFDEPWDGPNNRKLLNEFTWLYQCPAHRVPSGETTTCYFAVVGPDTVWPGAKPRGLDDLSDPSSVFLVIEGPPRKIQWSEPRDLTVEEAAALFTNPFDDNGAHLYDDRFFYTTVGGRNAAIADGSVRWLPPVLPQPIAQSLFSISEATTFEELDALPVTYPRRVKWANIMRLAILIFLTALPLPWAMARHRKRDVESSAAAVHQQT